jgi:hypothetical protein
MRRNPSTLAFGLSIVVSYVQSFLLWRLIGTPSAGTSIIGSCMTIALFLFAGRDMLVEGRRRFHDPKNQPVPLVPVIFLVVFGAIYFAEYLNSSSIVAHLLGDALFVPLFALMLTFESPSKTDGSRERVVFVSFICLTVVLLAFPTFAPAAF